MSFLIKFKVLCNYRSVETFSIIQQSLSLGCFPRVKVVYISDKYEGQVYVLEINME
ncbi:hypothetical protein IC582_007895 [Cucumis melo]